MTSTDLVWVINKGSVDFEKIDTNLNKRVVIKPYRPIQLPRSIAMKYIKYTTLFACEHPEKYFENQALNRLVIRDAGLGDLLLLEPILRQMNKDKHEITIITRFPDIFKNNPYIKEIIQMEAKSDIPKDIKMEDWDTYDDLRSYSETCVNRDKKHRTDCYNQIFNINIEDKEPRLYFSRKEEGSLKKKEGYNYIGIACDGSHFFRRYSYGIKLIDDILKADNKNVVVILGDGWEDGQGFVKYSKKDKRVIDLQGKTSIRQIINIIKDLDKMISVDTGLMHIALSLHIPTVCIFSIIDPKLRIDYYTGPKEVIYKNEMECIGCFPVGTNILDNDYNDIPIEKLKVGNKIISHKGNIRNIAKVFKRKHTSSLYTIEIAKGYKVITTPKHPIFGIKRKDVRCDLAYGTKMEYKTDRKGKERDNKYNLAATCNTNGKNTECTICKSIGKYNNPDFIEAKDLKRGDYVAISRKILKIKKNDKSINFARFLGWYLAEGSISRSRLDFSLNIKEVKYGEEIKQLGLKLGATSVTIKPIEKKNSLIVYVYGKQLAEKMLKYAGKYSYAKKLDKSIFSWSKKMHRNMLQTYFLGDGHLKKQEYSVKSTSKKLIYQIRLIFNKYGLCPSLLTEKEHTRKGQYHRESYKLILYGQEMNFLINLIDLDKYTHPFKRISKEYIFLPIRKIVKEEKNIDVYNLEIEKDNSYIANGICVHNCGSWHMAKCKFGSTRDNPKFIPPCLEIPTTEIIEKLNKLKIENNPREYCVEPDKRLKKKVNFNFLKKKLIMPIIVLNEEKNLPRFIELVIKHPAIGKVVAIDGGSDDKTIDLLKKAGAFVYMHYYDKTYHDAQALQRNISFSFVKDGEKCIMMDIDECFSEDLSNYLPTFLESNIQYGLLSRRTFDYYKDINDPTKQIKDYPDWQPRLFTWNRKFKWIGSPHHNLYNAPEPVRVKKDIIHFEKEGKDRDLLEKQWSIMQSKSEEIYAR